MNSPARSGLNNYLKCSSAWECIKLVHSYLSLSFRNLAHNGWIRNSENYFIKHFHVVLLFYDTFSVGVLIVKVFNGHKCTYFENPYYKKESNNTKHY